MEGFALSVAAEYVRRSSLAAAASGPAGTPGTDEHPSWPTATEEPGSPRRFQDAHANDDDAPQASSASEAPYRLSPGVYRLGDYAPHLSGHEVVPPAPEPAHPSRPAEAATLPQAAAPGGGGPNEPPVPRNFQAPVVKSSGAFTTAILSGGAAAGAIAGALRLKVVDPEKAWGALALSVGGGAVMSGMMQLISFADGLSGVDRSRGPGGRTARLLKYTGDPEGYGGNVTEFSPWCGLATASGLAVEAGYVLSRAGPLFSWERPSGKVYLTVAAVTSFFSVLGLLPTPAPNPDAFLREDRPSFLRRILRYIYIPFYQPILAVANFYLSINYYYHLLQTFGAYDKVGTLDEKVGYAEVVGQRIGYATAESTFYEADQVIGRKRVILHELLSNMKGWFMREPIPRVNVKTPTDDQVWSMCSKTVLAYNVTDCDKYAEHERVLDMTPVQYYATVPGVHYNVAKVYLRTDPQDPLRGKATRIVMMDGAVIHADGEEALWGLAKKHFVSTANFFAPSMLHNWVHFHFVDNATAMAHNIFPRGSLLHLIIQPFILGNIYTNHNGLAGLVVGDNMNSLTVQETSNYCNNDFFVNCVKHRSLAFYTGKSTTLLSDDVTRQRIKFGFPPKFEDDDSLPYTTFLRKAWRKFRDFAQLVSDLAKRDPTSYEQLRYWSSETVRRTADGLLGANVKHVDVLATFMWQVSLLHSLDHQTHFMWMLPQNGSSGARCAYTAPDAEKNMYTADDVRIYRQFTQTAGLYKPGEPDDSLRGIVRRYKQIEAQFPGVQEQVVQSAEKLLDNVNSLLKTYINEPENKVELDCTKIASAILT